MDRPTLTRPPLTLAAWCRRVARVGPIVVAAATLLQAPATAQPSLAESPHRVVVVGAGVSGLTVARLLHDNGISVVVVEARNRIGGRVWTRQIDGARLEMGAMFVQGPSGNPLARFMTASGLRYEPMTPTFKLYDSQLGSVRRDGADTVFRSLELFDRNLAAVRGALGPNASVADAIEHLLDRAELGGAARRIPSFALHQIAVEIFDASPPAQTSLAAVGVYEEFPGEDQVVVGGYGTVIEMLGRGLDIRLGEPVRRIQHSAAGIVAHSDSQRFEGSHVVVTVPLGVLKAGTIAFEPPLPDDKRAAIRRLGMGSLEKVILGFEDRFWRSEPGTSSSFFYLGEKVGELPVFLDFSDHAGAPTLVGLYGGGSARRTQETMTDIALKERSREILAEILDRPIPEPRFAAVTRWLSDPHARGSYSYIPVGALPEDMAQLAAPVGTRLLFAGEATVPRYYGTVHGAMLSGVREARRLGVEQITLPGLD